MKKIILMLLITATLNSCGLYKSYQRDEVSTDGLYRDAVSGSDTTSIGNISWKDLFTDPQLQVLIQKGLNNNSDLKIAQLRVTQAEASLQSARLAYVPSLGVNAQGTLNSFDNSKPSKTYQLAGSANWEIDVFGKLTNAKRGAKAAVQQSNAYRQAVQTQLIATIANSYYSLLTLDTQLDITTRTLVNLKENVRVIRSLKGAGQADESSVAQAEANCISVEASMLSIKQQVNQLENSLSTLLGEVPKAILRGTLKDQSFPTELTVGVPLQLLSNRPDVKQAEFALAQAFYATNSARSAFYPSITLGGVAGWSNSGGGMITNPGDMLLSLVGSLTQPIFNRGLNKARLKIAKAQQEEAVITFQQMLLNAGADVNNSLTQWQTAKGLLEYDVKQIEYLKSAVNSTELLMKYGNKNFLQVLIAQQSLLQAELTYASDKFGEIQGVINLYHSLGGGRL